MITIRAILGLPQKYSEDLGKQDLVSMFKRCCWCGGHIAEPEIGKLQKCVHCAEASAKECM